MQEQLKLISELLGTIKTDLNEIIFSALERMQANPKLTPLTAFQSACNDWDIIPTVRILSVTPNEDSGRTEYLISVYGRAYKLIEAEHYTEIFPPLENKELVIQGFNIVKKEMILSLSTKIYL